MTLRVGPVAGVLLACSVLLAGCVTRFAPDATIEPAATIEQRAERQIVVTVRNEPPRTAQHAGSTAKGYDATARYQVSPAALRDALSLAERYGLKQVAAWPIDLLGVHCVVFEVEGDRPLAGVLTQVRADGRVESAQSLNTFRTQAVTPYDDPYVGLQESVAAMQVEEAHRWSRGRGVRIAVIDSGVDDAHPDLASRIALSRDFTGLPARSGRLDTHGTAVAGVIAAHAGNGLGIIGVAPEARLLALRACWQVQAEGGAAAPSRCNTFTLAQALAAAIAERADVINLSLTGPGDPLLERLLRRAMSMGKIVISAVPELGAEAFPANLQGVLAVAAVEARASAAAIAGQLYAPGRNVLTLRPSGRYDYESGSSMAVANVTGVAALLVSVKHGVSASEMRSLLEAASAGTAGAGVGATAAGEHEVVNACRALATLAGRGGCEPIRRMHATLR